LSDTVLPNHLLNFSETELLKLPASTYKASKAYLSNDDVKKIQKAYTFAFYAHEGQKKEEMDQTISLIQLKLLIFC
jgi:hypothetical protein